MDLIKSEDYQVSKEYMEMMEEAVNNLDHKICSAVKVAINHPRVCTATLWVIKNFFTILNESTARD